MLIFFIVSLIIVCISFAVINFFLIKALKVQLNKVKTYQEWILDFKTQVENVYLEMKEIDNKNIFSRDDEVGIAFSDLLELTKTLNEKVE